LDCPAGRYQPDVASAACLPCVPGKFKTVAGKTECVDCAANTFSKLPGSSSCKDCGVGEKSEEGSASCLNCDAGKAGTGTGGACESCIKGRYRQSKKDDEWTFTITTQDLTASAGVTVTQTVLGNVVTGTLGAALTGADTKTIVVAATTGGSFITTTDIVVGTGGTALAIAYSTITNAGKVTPTDPSTCVGCPAGWWSESGSSKCQSCEAGSFSNTKGQECQSCIIGRYRQSKKEDANGADESTDPTTCVDCPAGRSSEAGSTKCQSCEAGRYSNIVGQDCIDCVDGQYRPSKIKGKTDDPTKCLNCKIGYTSKGGASTCDKCGEGSYGSEDGVCTECPTGYYQDVKGELNCAACPIDTYLTETGKKSKAECLACPTERSTGTAAGNINSTACLCKRKDYYQDHDGNCLVCPDGADCSDHDGITLAELGTQPGYWRVHALSIDFANCARGFSSSTSPKNDSIKRCPGSKNQNKSFDSDLQCRNNIDGTEAYGGPACMSCLDERYTMSGGKCTYCQEGASVGKTIGTLIGVMALLFLIFAFLFMRAKEEDDHGDKNKNKKKGCCGGINDKQKPDAIKQTKQQQIGAQRGTDAATRVVGDQALIGRLQGGGGGGGGGEAEAYRSDSQVVIDRVKIIYGWLQIFTALTFTFDIAW
jgi:hypothetical protein